MAELHKLKSDHSGVMESIESKLKVIEDSLNKRNEKYSNLVKE